MIDAMLKHEAPRLLWARERALDREVAFDRLGTADRQVRRLARQQRRYDVGGGARVTDDHDRAEIAGIEKLELCLPDRILAVQERGRHDDDPEPDRAKRREHRGGEPCKIA